LSVEIERKESLVCGNHGVEEGGVKVNKLNLEIGPQSADVTLKHQDPWVINIELNTVSWKRITATFRFKAHIVGYIIIDLQDFII